MQKRTLYTLSLLYLWIPTAILLLSWIVPWLGIPLALSGSWLVMSAFLKEKGEVKWMCRRKEIFLALLTLLLVVMSGVGGFYYPSSDQLWRTPTFISLVDYPWPAYGGDNEILCYFWGFWAVPALAAKATGIYQAGYLMQTVWAWIGLWLGVRLMFEFVGKAGLRIVLILVFLDGFNPTYIVYLHKCLSEYSNFTAITFLYPLSLIDMLSQVFNQVLASLVATMLVLGPGRRGRSALILACTVFQAPFTVITLFFVALWQIIESLRGCTFRKKIGKVLNVWNIIPIALILPLVHYCSLTDSTFRWVWEMSSYFVNRGQIDPLWGFLLTPLIMGLWIPFVWKGVKKSVIFWITIITPQIGLFVWLGINPDFNTRLWLPYVWLMVALIGRETFRWRGMTKAKRGMMLATGFACSAYGLDFMIMKTHDALTLPYAEWKISITKDIFDSYGLRDHFVGKVPEGEWILRPAREESADAISEREIR